MRDLLLLAAGAAVLGGAAYLALREPLLRPGDLVGLVGDSLAVGLAVPLARALEARGVVLDARGKGATIAGSWVGSPALLAMLGARPRAVVVVLGTNDCHYAFNTKPGAPCDVFSARMRSIAESIRAAGSVPCLAAMPPMPWEAEPAGAARMEAARDDLEAAARAMRGVYLPPPPFVVSRWPDDLHPDGAGAEAWAGWIADELGRARRLSWS